MISEAATSDGVLETVNQWVAAQADVIPVVPGWNVLIKHPNDIRSVLTSRNYTKETGPNRYFRANVADGVLTAPPERHRGERLVLNRATQDHELLDRVAVDKTDALAARLRRRAASGERVDLTAEVTRLTLAIVAEATLGWTDIDELEDALAAGTAVLQSRGLMLPPESAMAPIRKRCLQVINDMIEGCPDTRRRPVYIAMVDAGYDRETIADQILTLLLAGHETTANTLAWTWISLIRNPAVYIRWRRQLHTHPESASVVTRNIAREGLRLYPSSWIIGRVAIIDGGFDGVPVPAGCTVSISPFVTHRHPQFWGPDPEAFDPDRHNRPPDHRYAWLPFGAGARMCLGSTYAMREMEICLSILGKQFRFHSEDANSATPRFRFTLGTPPIRVDIEAIGGNVRKFEHR
ncbi:MAG TPA: cytochrome P450 [Mycobacterium sp.]|nr:cytochrome P450 [Mycobacterium sp.]